MRRTPALTVSALALTLAFGVVGCSTSSNDDSSPAAESSSSESPSSTPTSESNELDVAPAAGALITGDGYTYNVPEGWELQDKSIAPGTDTAAADVTTTTDFANNVNVILSPAGALTPDQVESMAAKELEAAGATDVTVEPRIMFGGKESAHISAGMTASGATYRIHQYYGTNDDQTYIVTFSFGTDVADTEAVEISESILASWTWS